MFEDNNEIKEQLDKRTEILKKGLEELHEAEAKLKKAVGISEHKYISIDVLRKDREINNLQKVIDMNKRLREEVILEKNRLNENYINIHKELLDLKNRRELLESQIDDLQRKLLEKEQENIILNESLKRPGKALEEERQGREQEVRVLKFGLGQEIAGLEKSLVDKEKIEEQRQKEWGALLSKKEIKICNLRDHLVKKEASWKKRFDQLSETLRETQAIKGYLEQEIEDKEKILEERKNRDEEVVSKDKEFKNIEILRKKEKELLDRNLKKKEEKIKELKEQLSQKGKYISDLRAEEKTELEEVNEELEKERKKIGTEEEEIEILQGTVFSLKRELERERKGREQEVQALKSGLGQEIKGLEKGLEAEAGRQEGWAKLLDDKEEKISSLRDHFINKEVTWKKQLDRLSESLRETQEINKQLEQKIKDKEKIFERMEYNNKELRRKEEEINILKERFSQNKEYIKDLKINEQTELGKVKKELEEKTTKVEALGNLIKEKSTEIEELKDKISKMGDEFAASKKEIQERLREKRFRCSSCQTEVPISAKYCPECGAEFRSKDTPKKGIITKFFKK